jgi:hypothetical protein
LGTKATQLLALLEQSRKELADLLQERRELQSYKEVPIQVRVDVKKLEAKRKLMALQVRYVEASIRNLCSRVDDADVYQELGPSFPLQGISLLLFEKKLMFALELTNQCIRAKGRRTSIAWLRRASSMTNLLMMPGISKPESSPVHSRHMINSINSIKQQLFRSHFVSPLSPSTSLSPLSSLDSMLSGAASVQFDLRTVFPVPTTSHHSILIPERVEKSETPEVDHAAQIREEMKKRSDTGKAYLLSNSYKTLLDPHPLPKRRAPSYQSGLKPPLEKIMGVQGIDREVHRLGARLDKALGKDKQGKPLKELYVEMTKVRKRRREKAKRPTPSTAPTSPMNGRVEMNLFGGQLPSTNLSPGGLLAHLRSTVQTLT